MNSRMHLLGFSIPLGRIGGVRLTVHWLQPVIWIWLALEFGLQMGTVMFVILTASVLIHEIGHVITGRWAGGFPDEIHLWPFGGLALIRGLDSLSARIIATAGGPLFTLALCALSLPAVLTSAYARDLWNPFIVPFSADVLANDWVTHLQVLVFVINRLLLLASLIPAVPMDGGQLLRGILIHLQGRHEGGEISQRVGMVVSVLIMVIAGLFLDQMPLLFLGVFLFLWNLMESIDARLSEAYDGEGTVGGYDFSEGYTSLERDERRARQDGLWKQWQERRRKERAAREQERLLQAELKLDELLAKVHEQGMGSLTEAERRQLREASHRIKEKGKPTP